jgi:hypothetical protein
VKIDLARLYRTGLQESQQSAAVSRQRFTRPEAVGQEETILLPALEVGEEISAIVVGELDDGRVVLNLGGVLIEADNPGGLAAGQNLRLRVDFLEPQIMLHIIDQELTLESEAAGLLRQRLPGLTSENETLIGLQEKLAAPEMLLDAGMPQVSLEKLRNFIADILDNHRPLDPERLMQFVRDSGLHYENKLFRAVMDNTPSLAAIADSDLKGLLLGALENLERGAVWGEPRHAIASQLDHLEIQQAVNLLAQLEGQPLQIRIPFFTGAGFADVALSVQRDGKGRGEESGKSSLGYTIMFLLDLDNFGRTRIETHLKGQDLRVLFYVDQDDSVALLRRELPGFAVTLKAMGYREVLLAARTTQMMRAEQQRGFEALALGLPPNLHLLNVKV